MLIVGDTQEMFMPLLDGFLCTPEESGPIIDALMQQIPEMFGDTRETETILLPAILAGLEALKVCHINNLFCHYFIRRAFRGSWWVCDKFHTLRD